MHYSGLPAHQFRSGVTKRLVIQIAAVAECARPEAFAQLRLGSVQLLFFLASEIGQTDRRFRPSFFVNIVETEAKVFAEEPIPRIVVGIGNVAVAMIAARDASDIGKTHRLKSERERRRATSGVGQERIA